MRLAGQLPRPTRAAGPQRYAPRPSARSGSLAIVALCGLETVALSQAGCVTHYRATVSGNRWARVFGCPLYDDCLSAACRAYWPSFTCARCAICRRVATVV